MEFFHPMRDPIWHNMIANRPKLNSGYFQLSDNPGLGWELDRDYIAKYRIAERVSSRE
jgi:L-alanine-DL-glutamate epimerase-like enolase superfamily enzyme